MVTNKKIFITGGNGFIGSRVVHNLIEQGYKVRCLLRPTSNTRRIDGLDIERVIGDVRDAGSVKVAMRGCTGIIHLAGLSNWADIHSPLMNEVIIQGSSHVIEAAREHENLPMVFVSSIIGINGTDEPVLLTEKDELTLPRQNEFSYAYAKQEVEQRCHNAAKLGLPVTIVNPVEVYGPNDDDLITAGNLIDFANSPVVMVPRGGTSVAHVDDVALGIIAALEKGRPGERYILGGDNLHFWELATLTLDILGLEKKIINVPNRVLTRMAKTGKKFNLPLPFEPSVIPYAVKYWFADNHKARTELKVEFRPARAVLTPTIQWLQEYNHIRQ
ncbi:NAD-dependent epimerase/dehydratase family protein [Anaerolineales bacterium HSG6]|nr:NAD-dependent epimerase/dehydratase family protein [Anaerolineales bacterium HSG6]MDM8531369.1 NAD-dependent epimerase/dehydratase family protein [Anaerolineales bacterium HSG25]